MIMGRKSPMMGEEGSGLRCHGTRCSPGEVGVGKRKLSHAATICRKLCRLVDLGSAME